MKFLPYSNGVRKVNMKKQIDPKQKFKIVVTIIGLILGIGLVFQSISNFIAKETLKQKLDYTTVNDLRLDYRLKGEGNYTVVFDGSLGGNLDEWTPVINELQNQDIQTFVYNRRGYGFSSSGQRITPEEQAQNLKILLRKAGASEPYILVGEEYGSLVLTSFAEQFPDSVAGVVLVDPINENDIIDDNYKKSHLINRIRRKIESIGSNFSLTMILDKLNLDIILNDFEENLDEEELHEFKTHRTKSSYTSAVYNETLNLINGDSNSQKEGVFAGKPYYLLTKNNDDRLKVLGSEDFTKVYNSTCEKDFFALNDTENVVTAISDVVDTLKRIDEQKKLKS